MNIVYNNKDNNANIIPIPFKKNSKIKANPKINIIIQNCLFVIILV
jgi:hypothetical protein